VAVVVAGISAIANIYGFFIFDKKKHLSGSE
jgi:hypothetical protein